MRKEELSQFAEMWVAYCQINRPDYNVSPVQMGIIAKQFINYELKEITAALDVVISKTPFQITPADVLSVLNSVAVDELSIKADRAYDIAFSASCGHCKRAVVFDDPVISETINEVFGGWISFCDLNPDYKEADRKRFVKGYMQIANSGRSCKRVLFKGDQQCSYSRLICDGRTVTLTDDQLSRYLVTGEVPKLELVPDHALVDSLPVVDDPILLAKLKEARDLDELMGMVLNTKRMEVR